MPTTSNFGWTTPADTDLVKDGAAAIRTLGNGIDTSLVDLKGGTTGQVLSKASNTDLDFSWVAQDDSNAIQNALLTTTGDTIYASAASTPARLGIGSSGQVLTVAGGVPTWATPAGGGKVLQVVQSISTTATAIATQTMTDSGLSGSITPSSASSKVLIFISQNVDIFRTANSGNGAGIRLLRGSTTILDLQGSGTNETLFHRAGIGDSNHLIIEWLTPIFYLDTPNTTSSVTYKTQLASQSVANDGAVTCQKQGTDSVMILMEIGA
jgi:hypothetical protein